MKTVTIESLSHEGRGIAHEDGKTIFVDNALPGETVKFNYLRRHKRYDEGVATDIANPSNLRNTPPCPHYGVCGGCNLQHLQETAQVAHKQKVLLEQLQHFGETTPPTLLAPLTGPNFGYRRKARLGVKYVNKKETLMIGFREKNGRYLADLHQCEVLIPEVGHRITALKTLITQLEAYLHIPQIEVATGDNAVALIIRHLQPLSTQDLNLLTDFAKTHDLRIYLQPQGYDSIHLLWPKEAEDLYYDLPEHQVRIYFQPHDFTQVNAELNRKMVKQTLQLLDINKNDRVLDLFCGLGNFTLPLAKLASYVVGVEGDQGLVNRAIYNAQHSNITNVAFYAADLNAELNAAPWSKEPFNKLLLDPPRTGALAIVEHPTLFKSVEKVVYVSCNPATLARDTKVLIQQQGFKLQSAGIMNMFPHTAHVESVAMFVRE